MSNIVCAMAVAGLIKALGHPIAGNYAILIAIGVACLVDGWRLGSAYDAWDAKRRAPHPVEPQEPDQ